MKRLEKTRTLGGRAVALTNGSAIASGVRAALATLVPFFLAAALARPELAWMAMGGWLGTLADPGGARQTRARTIGVFAVLGATLIMVAERCAGLPWLATMAMAIIACAGTLAGALGPSAATIGTLSAIIAAIATTNGTTGGYAVDAALFLLGAAWATVLSSIVWPIGTHAPVRAAVAEVYRALHDYVCEIERHTEAPNSSDALGRAHQRKIREAIEKALAMALSVRARRAGESPLGSDLRVLIGMAEAQFPQLITIAEEAARNTELPPSLGARLRVIAMTYEEVEARVRQVWPGRSLTLREGEAETPPDDAPYVDRIAARMAREAILARHVARSLGAKAPSIANANATATATATATAKASDERDAMADPDDDISRPGASLADALRTLRDALEIRSVHFRHALRIAVVAIVASTVGHAITVHPHWVTITALAVLQPYAGPTWTRAAERLVGTVFGSLVAVAITMTIRSPLILAGLMFPLSVAAVATKARSYRWFTFFLTPVFVLIAETKSGDWWTAAARAGDAMVGGAIAVTGALLLWPTWERRRLTETIATMVSAVGVYQRKVLGAVDRAHDAALQNEIAGARRTAGIAIGEAEASLERAMAEPHRKRHESQLERSMQLVTHARRLANACTALDTRVAYGAPRELYLAAIATYEDLLTAPISSRSNET